MELKNESNFFRFTFVGGTEFFIKSDKFQKTSGILDKLSDGVMKNDFFALKQTNTQRERNPVHFRRTALLSVEKVDGKMIGNINKLWEML